MFAFCFQAPMIDYFLSLKWKNREAFLWFSHLCFLKRRNPNLVNPEGDIFDEP